LGAISEEHLARTVLAYYCSPANPQGAAADLETYSAWIEAARRHGFILASDECYSELYDRKFDGAPPPGAASACAALGGDMRNVAVFNSLSKRSSAPGLRAGFVAGDPDYIKRYVRLRDYSGAPPPLPLSAAAEALWRDEAHVVENRELYRRKFDIADEILAGRFGYYRPDGGFYLWLDVGDGEDAAVRLWRDAAVRVIPGVYLAKRDSAGVNPGAGYIRCALVHDLNTTRAALERMKGVLEG
jgi:N-succinyldiaminopimelate aminotransferase